MYVGGRHYSSWATASKYSGCITRCICAVISNRAERQMYPYSETEALSVVVPLCRSKCHASASSRIVIRSSQLYSVYVVIMPLRTRSTLNIIQPRPFRPFSDYHAVAWTKSTSSWIKFQYYACPPKAQWTGLHIGYIIYKLAFIHSL